jgi:hypothetical protein
MMENWDIGKSHTIAKLEYRVLRGGRGDDEIPFGGFVIGIESVRREELVIESRWKSIEIISARTFIPFWDQ